MHWSDDAEMYLKAPVDKSSEKFAIFNVNPIIFGDHWYPLNAVLSGDFFASVLPTWMLSFQDHEASDIIRN